MAACLLPVSVFGQAALPASGNWSTGSISNNQTVNLTDDVTINGTITIKNGGSLTIKNGTEKEVTIQRSKPEIKMFDLKNGGRLTIEGENGKMIVIDGGAELEWDESEWNSLKYKGWKGDCEYDGFGYKYKPLKGREVDTVATMISTYGDLTLKYVQVQNFDAGNKKYYAIHVASSKGTKCGKTDLSNCMITKCRAEKGAAINVNIQNKDATNTPASCAVTLTDVTITQCMVNPDHNDKDEAWGGVIRFNGKSVSNLTMTRCTMKQNYSTGDGSCLWWNAGGSNENPSTLVLDGCRFENNRADRDAGAVRLESGFRFEGKPTVFEKNSCGRYGGAVQVADYNSGSVETASFEYDLNEKMNVENNHAAEGGGGIAFYYVTSELKDGTTFNINLNGLKVSGNTAGERGGGMLFTDLKENATKTYNFNIYLNGGNISSNSAVKAGGGIFARKMNISTTDVASNVIKITDNKVTAAAGVEEGARGGGGGINLYDGNMHLASCVITGNTVTAKETDKGFGGGIMLNRSDFTLSGNNNLISNNTANMGGGVAVLNNTDTKKVVTLNSGNIRGNKANLCGGGIGIVGYAQVSVDGVNIENNTALNAGGVYLRGRDDGNNNLATLTYTGGEVAGNRATSKSGSPASNTTAYQLTTNDITGIGGGFCVGENSTLELLVTERETLGIHGNTADNGADDIFCNGKPNTKIVLPGVANMSIEGRNSLFWVEDYITNDTGYKNGTNVNTSWSRDNIRCRDAIQKGQPDQIFYLSQPVNGSPKYSFNEEYNGSAIYKIFNNQYLCLTLSEISTYITLQKYGMGERDNAIFDIYRWNISKGETIPTDLDNYRFLTLILTDADAEDNTRTALRQYPRADRSDS